MKEEKIKDLMKESLLKTSEGFTDELMESIEKENVSVQIPLWPKIALIISVVCMLTIPLILHLLTASIRVSSVLIYTPIILLIFILINKYMHLNEEQLVQQEW